MTLWAITTKLVTNRILDFSEGGCFLRVQDKQLKVERKGEAPHSIPIEDIAVLVAGTGWLTMTQPVLAELATQGAVVLIADSKFLPVAMSLPLYGHSLQAQKLRVQTNVSAPIKKRLWKEIVSAKITHQSKALNKLHNTDDGLSAMVRRVRSGDPDNVEAQAARHYWPRLFRDSMFRREPGGGEPPNHFLDYGYSVLRAILARAVCASGLHPTLGLHHHERDNSFALADDLMEPFRPLVDLEVAALCRDGLSQAPLNRTTKARLIEPLLKAYHSNGELRTLFDIAGILTASIIPLYNGERETLPLPDLFSS